MIDNYAEFANFYDDATTTDNPGKIKLIKKLIAQHAPEAHSILEIGCGTGTILEAFAPDYEVTGLDLSQPMLDIAAAKVPSGLFVAGDMSTFELGKRYDVILCIFDSINHLLDFKDWEKTFERVSVHLATNGLFVFDVNTQAKLEARAAAEPVEAWVNERWVVANMIKRSKNKYEWQIEIDDQPIVVPEAAFPIKKIEKAAEQYFSVKEKLTDDGSSVSKSTMRVYFACQKD
jgi:SAM-dependent methyltransferase